MLIRLTPIVVALLLATDLARAEAKLIGRWRISLPDAVVFFNFHRDHTVHVEDLKYRAVFAEGTWRLEAHKLSVHTVGADFLQKPRSPDFTWTLVSVSDNQLKLKDAGSDIVRVHQRVR